MQTLLIPRGEFFNSERRFWWLWGVEAATIACFLSTVFIRRKPLLLSIASLTVITFACNPRLKDLAEKASPGTLAAAIRGAESNLTNEFSTQVGSIVPCAGGSNREAIDALANILKRDGRDRERIGYDMNFYPWQMETRLADGKSKNFEDWDLALQIRHGIQNLDTSAEGISEDDEYVVFSPDYNYTSMQNPIPAKRWALHNGDAKTRMERIAIAGGYEIWKKKPLQPTEELFPAAKSTSQQKVTSGNG